MTEEKEKRKRKKSLICWSQCKVYAISYVVTHRAHKFERISADVKDYLEGVVRQAIEKVVSSHPSRGKTIQMGTHKRKEQHEGVEQGS